MREIEKIQKLIGLVQSDPEKEAIVHAEEVLASAFHAMLGQTQEYLTDGVKPAVDPVGIREAFAILKKYGDTYGVEFPNIDNKNDLLMYIIKYAKEIISDDEQ